MRKKDLYRSMLFILLLQLSIFVYSQPADSSIKIESTKSLLYFKAGGSIFVATKPTDNAIISPCITIEPGFRIINGNDLALTLSSPVSVGLSLKENDKSFLALDLPAMLELHFGSSTGNKAGSKLGFMIGTGMGYHFAGRYEDDYYNPPTYEQVSFWGYRFTAGISFGQKEDGDATMITFNFGKAFNQADKSLFGIGLMLIMGNRYEKVTIPSH